MSPCASCGLTVPSVSGLCPHHHAIYGDDWATSNRIWNDYFMRKKAIPRLTEAERSTEFWEATA